MSFEHKMKKTEEINKKKIIIQICYVMGVSVYTPVDEYVKKNGRMAHANRKNFSLNFLLYCKLKCTQNLPLNLDIRLRFGIKPKLNIKPEQRMP